MNKTSDKISFFSNIQKIIKENVKIIISIVLCIIIIILSFQIYFFYENKKILELSIFYNESINTDSKSEFLEKMKLITKNKNLYGLMASLEIINYKTEIEKYNESYDDYLKLLKRKNIENLYITLISIHASYNLLGKIDSDKILNLLSYVDNSLESFVGYHLELLFLLSLIQNNIEKTNDLYNQIIKNDNISLLIKERVEKLNEFEKYK